MTGTRSRLKLPTILLLTMGFVAPVAAVEPAPDLPLPDCIDVDGQEQGACPDLNENVLAAGTGKLTEGVPIPFDIFPALPVCDEHLGFTAELPWNPSPCYSAVHAPVVLGCGYIDFFDGNRWKETNCTTALFRNASDAQFPMFTVAAAEGSSACGGRGNYQTFIFGGPANVPGATWREVGPTTLGCQVTFNGPRPDGLFGTTWVKLRFGIDRAETGDNRRGSPEFGETFVRIDGDLREELPDLNVLSLWTLDEVGDEQIVTFEVRVTNNGEVDAEDVQVVASYAPLLALGQDVTGDAIDEFPPFLHVASISDSQCLPIRSFVGGSLNCSFDLAAGEERIIEVVTRVTNASDLPPVNFKALLANDADPSDNEDRANVRLDLASGSIEQTRAAMEALAPFFNYETDIRAVNAATGQVNFTDLACNSYKRDIFSRLERIRLDNPQVFDNLSYGPITSGDYFTAAGTRAGHVGMVVYPKGTDYKDTGIVIHGLPSPSPLAQQPDRFDTQVGTFPLGAASPTALLGFTAISGLYYRTPVGEFPGIPRPENLGCGFEGLVSDNAGEFSRPRSQCVPIAEAGSCPFAPAAVVVTTESPVDLRITNSEGQQIETSAGAIMTEELGRSINSLIFPHEDGTFGWSLVLPPDDYEVELIGVGDGPYRLTMSRYNREAEIFQIIVEGVAEPGVVEQFQFIDTIHQSSFEGSETPGR